MAFARALNERPPDTNEPRRKTRPHTEMSIASMQTTDTPRALRVNEKAVNLDALQLEAAPQPQPTAPPGHAVVQVAAAAVNPSDVKAALGLMPQAVWPRTPGRDFAGTVVSGPAEWIGREVYGSGEIGRDTSELQSL